MKMRLKLDHVLVNLVLVCICAFFFQSSEAQLSGCQPSTCKNGGTCIPQPDLLYGFKCLCPPNYQGVNCQLYKSGSGFISGGGSGPAAPSGGSINIGGGGSANPGGINIGGGGSSGGGSINIGGGGGMPGGSINIGGGGINGGGSININKNSACLNGGTFVRQGLPCACPVGYSGNRCEMRSGANSNYINSCTYNPCKNGGLCSTLGNGGYQCTCLSGFTGTYCEYSTYGPRRGSSKALGISLGSILPFLLFVGIIALCIYCCCCKNRNSDQPNRFVPNVFGGGGAVPNNRPFQPVQPMFANPRPPTVYNPQPMPDPDEVFKTQSPPPYESVVATKPA